MTTHPVLRLGIIGCGYQGQWLARAAAALPALRVVACADPDLYAAQAVATYAPDARLYTGAADLVQQPDVDAVCIATPHHLLAPCTLHAVEAGKHVLAEKPIALNLVEARQIEASVRRQGVTYMAGYSFRYLREPRLAHDLLTASAIGEIQAVSAGIGRSPMTGSWWVDPKAGGGPLLFIGSHLVDQLLWYLADRPVEVYADVRYHHSAGTDIPGVDATSAFQIRFSRGAVAHCLVTDAADSWFAYLHLIGSAGKLHLAMPSFPHYTLTLQSQTAAPLEPPTSAALDRDSLVLAKMRAELADFAGAQRAAGRRRGLGLLEIALPTGQFECRA